MPTIIDGTAIFNGSDNKGSKRTKAIELEYDVTHYDNYTFLFENGEDVDEVWFKYKPKKDCEARILVDSSIFNDYSITLYDGRKELTTVTTGEDIHYELEKGNKYYVKVTLNYSPFADTGFGIKLGTPIPKGSIPERAYELNYGANAPKDYQSLLDYDYGNLVWFKYTPEEGGVMAFTLTELDAGAYISLYNSYYLESSIAEADAQYGLTYTLDAGNDYYYCVSFGGYLDTNFGVELEKEVRGMSELTAYEVELGNNSYGWESIEMKGRDYVWLAFTPEADGYYSFTVEGIDNEYDASIVIPDDHDHYFMWSEIDGIEYYKLESYNGKHYVKIGFTDGLSIGKFDVKIDRIEGRNTDEAIELVAGEELRAQHVSPYHQERVYFEFTPANSGWYAFELTDYSYSGYYLNLLDCTYVYDAPLYYELVGGNTYYLEVCPYYSSDFGFSIKVDSVSLGESAETAISVSLGKNPAALWDSIADGDVWFSFTPEADGYYSFASTNGKILSYEVIDAYACGISYEYLYDNTVYELYGGETYYIYCYDLLSSFGAFSLDISKTASGKNNADAIALIDGEQTKAGYHTGINENGEVWFSFTPEVSGNYHIEVSSASRRYFWLFDGDMNGIYGNSIDYISDQYNDTMQYLVAGETYYIEIRFYSSAYYDSSFYVKVS